MQDMEAGLVGGEPGAFDLHAAERPHRDAAVGFAAPGTAPVLQLQQFQRRGVDEQLDGILVAEPVAAGDGVVEMVVQAVVVLDDAGRAAFGGHGVAAHRIDLGDQRKREGRIGLGDRDGGAQAGAAGAHDRDVDFNHVHEAPFPRTAGRFTGLLREDSMRHGAEKALIWVNAPSECPEMINLRRHAAIWARSSPVISVMFPGGIAPACRANRGSKHKPRSRAIQVASLI